MRVHTALDVRLAREPGEQMPDLRVVKRRPSQRANEWASAWDDALAAKLEPASHQRDSADVDANDAAPAAFSPLHHERA